MFLRKVKEKIFKENAEDEDEEDLSKKLSIESLLSQLTEMNFE